MDIILTNNLANQLVTDTDSLVQAKKLLMSYRNSLTSNWQSKEIIYITGGIDSVINDIDAMIGKIEKLSDDIKRTAADIKREDDEAAARAAEIARREAAEREAAACAAETARREAAAKAAKDFQRQQAINKAQSNYNNAYDVWKSINDKYLQAKREYDSASILIKMLLRSNLKKLEVQNQTARTNLEACAAALTAAKR